MANALYPKCKENLLQAVHSLQAHVIRASLVRGYTYSGAHAGKGDLPAPVADSPQLTAPTILDGTFDTADFTWAAVPTGAAVPAIVTWNDSPAGDPLLAYYDTGMGGMPVTPNGGNLNRSEERSVGESAD